MSYQIGLSAVASVLSRMCVTTSVCPFFKGLVCPIESYMRDSYPALLNTPICMCSLATEEIWHEFLLTSAKQELEPSPTVEGAD